MAPSITMENSEAEKICLPSPAASWDASSCLRVVCLSDTHTKHHEVEVPDGDILIHSGDFTNKGSKEEVNSFDIWLGQLPHKHKVVVPGNHDSYMDPEVRKKGHTKEKFDELNIMKNAHVLINSAVSVEGFTIAGSPYTVSSSSRFKQMLKGLIYTYAFGASDPDLEDILKEVPVEDVDILVTHSPPLGFGDGGKGSMAIRKKVFEIDPILHVFGHIHEQGGNIFQQKQYVRKGCETVGTEFAPEDEEIRTTFANAAVLKASGINSCIRLCPLDFFRTPIVLDIDKRTRKIVMSSIES